MDFYSRCTVKCADTARSCNVLIQGGSSLVNQTLWLQGAYNLQSTIISALYDQMVGLQE